jgi:hypothetical protein
MQSGILGVSSLSIYGVEEGPTPRYLQLHDLLVALWGLRTIQSVALSQGDRLKKG